MKDYVLIRINAHPNSSQNKIVSNENTIDVYVNDPPDKGKANRAIIKLLAKQLDVNTSQIVLVKGLKAKKKVVQIKNIDLKKVFRIIL